MKAQDAIDNMDMNELRGKVLKVSMARPQRAPVQGAGNRAGECMFFGTFLHGAMKADFDDAV